MSVDRTDYIIYGWKLPYEIKDENDSVIDFYENEDKYLPYIEGHEGIDYAIIQDDMAGKYTVFGKVVLRGGDQWSGWEFEDIKIDSLWKDELINKYCELFCNDPKLPEPKLFIFSHFN